VEPDAEKTEAPSAAPEDADESSAPDAAEADAATADADAAETAEEPAKESGEVREADAVRRPSSVCVICCVTPGDETKLIRTTCHVGRRGFIYADGW